MPSLTPGSRRWVARVLGVLVLLTGAVTGAAGQCVLFERETLRAHDAGAMDAFGWEVALSGNVALVGASSDGDLGQYSGSAYVYRFDGARWNEEQKLVASDRAAGDQFGRSVALDGDVVVIGAPHGDQFAGSAYVYRREAGVWQEKQKLVASDRKNDDMFGTSVAVDGDVLISSAYWDDRLGSVYVFRFDGASWVEEQELRTTDPAAGLGFGFSSDLSGDVIVADGVPRERIRSVVDALAAAMRHERAADAHPAKRGS